MPQPRPPRRIGPADIGRGLTLEEFRDVELEEGYRYELARGVLEVTLAPGEARGRVIWMLLSALAAHDRRRPGVIDRAGGSGGYRLWLPGRVSCRDPDIAVVLRNTSRNLRGQHPPALVMEVVAAGSEAHERDYATRREEYLAYCLDEYWIVDRFARRVTVLIRDGDGWIERVFVDGQVAEGFVLPGFAVPVLDIWAAIEDAGDDEEG